MVQKNNKLEQVSIKCINAGTISLIQDFKESRNSFCFDLRIMQSKQKTQNIFFHMIDGWDFFWSANKKWYKNTLQHSKNWYRSGRWLCNWLSIRVFILKKNTSIIDLKVIQQINLTENLERVRNTETFFIIKEVKKNVLKF